MVTMLRWLHGLIERFGVRVYRNGAHQLNAESAHWNEIEILSDPKMLPRLLEGLNLLLSGSPRFCEAVRDNLKTIICVKDVITKTLPVTRVLLINAEELARAEQNALAYMLVRSAAYCSFYRNKTIFVPTLFFRARDKQAKSDAQQLATEFRNEIES
jgi:hypothetical protein